MDVQKLFENYGYTILLDNNHKNKKDKSYTFELYLDNGESYGRFYIPSCTNCIDKTDELLWIESEFKRVYPELFKGK